MQPCLGAPKAYTNTKTGPKKHGGSIDAHGLLVGMVSARFEKKQQPLGAERPVGGWCVPLNRAETIPTNNPYAPIHFHVVLSQYRLTFVR